jgi:energy-coupling factor transporter transmembrane protein EcfT
MCEFLMKTDAVLKTIQSILSSVCIFLLILFKLTTCFYSFFLIVLFYGLITTPCIYVVIPIIVVSILRLMIYFVLRSYDRSKKAETKNDVFPKTVYDRNTNYFNDNEGYRRVCNRCGHVNLSVHKFCARCGNGIMQSGGMVINFNKYSKIESRLLRDMFNRSYDEIAAKISEEIQEKGIDKVSNV